MADTTEAVLNVAYITGTASKPVRLTELMRRNADSSGDDYGSYNIEDIIKDRSTHGRCIECGVLASTDQHMVLCTECDAYLRRTVIIIGV